MFYLNDVLVKLIFYLNWSVNLFLSIYKTNILQITMRDYTHIAAKLQIIQDSDCTILNSQEFNYYQYY